MGDKNTMSTKQLIEQELIATREAGDGRSEGTIWSTVEPASVRASTGASTKSSLITIIELR